MNTMHKPPPDVAGRVIRHPDTIDLLGAVAPGPSNTVLFQTAAQRVFLDRRIIVVHDDGTVTIPRWHAKEKGLIA